MSILRWINIVILALMTSTVSAQSISVAIENPDLLATVTSEATKAGLIVTSPSDLTKADNALCRDAKQWIATDQVEVMKTLGQQGCQAQIVLIGTPYSYFAEISSQNTPKNNHWVIPRDRPLNEYQSLLTTLNIHRKVLVIYDDLNLPIDDNYDHENLKLIKMDQGASPAKIIKKFSSSNVKEIIFLGSHRIVNSNNFLSTLQVAFYKNIALIGGATPSFIKSGYLIGLFSTDISIANALMTIAQAKDNAARKNHILLPKESKVYANKEVAKYYGFTLQPTWEAVSKK